MNTHKALSIDAPDRETVLRKQYGELLRLSDLAPLLSYPSVQAVQKARQRGSLPLPVFQIPGRKGWFITTRTVAQFLNELDQDQGGAQ